MQSLIDKFIDQRFLDDYEDFMLSICGSDQISNPHAAKHGIFHNFRPWESYQAFKYAELTPTDVVLDTGAMHTYFCIYCARFAGRIYATDNFYWGERDYVAKEHLFSPQEWAKYVESKGNDKIIAETADIAHLQYADSMFDKIFCISTIEHVAEDEKSIRELARVLKKGGRLLLTTEFNALLGKKYSEYDGTYYRIYSARSLQRLIESSGLRALSPHIMLERQNYFLAHRFVAAFICLEK